MRTSTGCAWTGTTVADDVDPWPEDPLDAQPEVSVGDRGWGPSAGSDDIVPWDPASSPSSDAGHTGSADGSGGVDDGWIDDVDGGVD